MSSCDVLRWNQQHWGLEVGGEGVGIANGDPWISDISRRVDGGHAPS